MKKVLLSVVAALAVSAAPAFAADIPVKAATAPVAAPSPWDLAFGSALMSDYVFRGVTQSNHKPSVAAYFEPRYNINKDLQLYAGISGESISFPNRAAAEIDFYAGVRPTFGQLALDFGFWYYDYPGGQCFNTGTPVGAFGADCAANGNLPLNGNVIKSKMSFWEVYAKPTWNVNDSLAIGATLFYTPSMMNSGANGTYLSGTAKYTLPATMLPSGIGSYISGEFGRQWLGTTDSFYGLLNTATGAGINYADYDTWNVGLGFTWKVFTLDLRYSDSSLSKADCNAYTSDHTATFNGSFSPINPSGVGSNWCGARFLAKLSADLTLGSLK
jgi:Bacterial protein of unknown function (Gcw_chp)